MARKSLGYTKLVWVCQNCQTRNPGPEKTCVTCGSPQPVDVSFIQADNEELIKKEEEILRAKKGMDVHCPYCGTRNTADTKICSNCGGDLIGGKKRIKGRVVGAYKQGTGKGVKCLACGNINIPNAARCSNCGGALEMDGASKSKSTEPSKINQSGRLIWIVVGLLAVLIAGLLIGRSCSRSVVIGTVDRVEWTRSVVVEQYQTVIREDWWEDIPDSANLISCEDRYRYNSDQPEENSIEVCGTPYTVDQGSGFGEVVQDCEYEVYDTYCEYEVSDWEIVDVLEMGGHGTFTNWPTVDEYGNQRAGESTESYTIWFQTEEGRASYEIGDYSLYQSCRVGSEWELSFDGFGNIREISPR